MTHRGIRAFLVVLAFAAAAGGGYLLRQLDEREESRRSASRTFEGAADQALMLVERFRAAQQSYVADGQGGEFWMVRAKDVLDQLERTLTTLAGTAGTAELRDASRATAATVEELRKMDARAREWMRGGQGLMASDLIFTESLALSGSLTERLGTLRARHQQLADAERSAIRQQEIYVLGGAAAVCLIVALLLAPAVRPSTPQDTREALRALIGDPATTPAQRPESGVRLPGSGAHAAALANGTPASAAPVAQSSPSSATVARAALSEVPRSVAQAPAHPAVAAPQPPTPPSVDVQAAAQICAGLARVLDSADLPRLLERSAALLKARGLIVWIADETGTALFPMLAHGYSPAILSRMGSLRREDENATAEAYRLGEEGVVPAKNGEPGAIVTPIVTADGCVGVLAAEVECGAEEDRDRRALAAILAAQLATLVTVLPAPARALHAQG